MKKGTGAVALLLLVLALVGGGCGARARSPEGGATAGHAPEAHGEGGGAAAGEEMCAEHGVGEAECGICNPDAIAGLEAGQGLKVRLPAADSADLVGVRTARPEAGTAAEGIDCFAEVVFDQNRLARIAPQVSGIVHSVEVDLGARVREGETVARIWSAEIADVVAQAVLSHQTLARERRLRAEGITPEKDLQAAEAVHRAACQQARTLGFSEREIEALGSGDEEPTYLELRSPLAGEIVERDAVRGALVQAGQTLFAVADRSVMWALISVPEAALSRVRVGQEVQVTVDALPGSEFRGKLTWVSAQVDERTRMARARAALRDPEGRLRDRMFAQARILAGEAKEALLVPAEAVHVVEGKPLVFVRLADDLYEARAVRLGDAAGGRREIVSGLAAEEEVAVAHGFALKSQLLASRLGAACADD